MTRRALILAAIAALIPAHASADLAGTRRQRHADRRCQLMGRAYERRGLTAKERARLEWEECHQVGGEWVSAKVFAA